MDAAGLAGLLDTIAREATLFAAVGFLIGGLDDLAVDILFAIRIGWHRLRHRGGVPVDRRPPAHRIAVFVPAWQEHEVLGAMLRHALARFDHPDYRIYVGCYPNDPATTAVAAQVALTDARVRVMVGTEPGGTTKGDNLNTLWRALLRDEGADGWRADAIVLHDAEDVVHGDELLVIDRLLHRNSVVQLPVLPLIADGAHWVSGHYADEFAESHGKNLVVRQLLGAGLPLAGVGCAIRRDALDAVAAARAAGPFDAASLTEDYELGLRIAEMGGRGRFVRQRDAVGALIAVRSYFPATVGAAVRQKARWITGIALAGWDRTGWSGAGRIGDHWMRMRDRRAPLAMLVLAAAYLAVFTGFAAWGMHLARGNDGPPLSPWTTYLLIVNAVLLVWRVVVRAACTWHGYGWREGMLSVPRMVVANFITLVAAQRAIRVYLGMLRGAPTRWDKTEHRFPDLQAAAP